MSTPIAPRSIWPMDESRLPPVLPLSNRVVTHGPLLDEASPAFTETTTMPEPGSSDDRPIRTIKMHEPRTAEDVQQC